MFGNKTKLTEEEYGKLHEKAQIGEGLEEVLAKDGEKLTADFASTIESQRQMDIDVHQVFENVTHVQEYANQNIDAAAILARRVDELGTEMEKAEKEYARFLSLLSGNVEDSQNAVEQNKHFTTPSRYLSELPEELRKQNAGYLEALDAMSELGKQMGVLSLNAAIEAGRMGENGLKFVSAVDEVRGFSKQYEQAVSELRSQIAGQEERLKTMEDIITQFVGLVKDNNMNLAKLMRSVMDTQSQVEKSGIRPFAGDVKMLGEAVCAIKSMEEEILKTEDRNHMQMEDIIEELVAQRSDTKEIEAICSQISALAQENNNTGEA